jgi:hypothetical protein
MKSASLIIGILMSFATAAQAVILNYEVNGTIRGTVDFITIGDPVKMFFSYDDSIPENPNSSQTQGFYVGTAQGIFDMRIEITTSTGLWTTTANTGNIGIGNPELGFDSFQITSTLPPATWTSQIFGVSPDAFKLELLSSSGDLYTDVSLPSSLDLADFSNSRGTIYIANFNNGFSPTFDVNSIQVVPEPSAFSALLGIFAIAIASKRRLRRS